MIVTIVTGGTIVFKWDMTSEELIKLNEFANNLVEE